MFEFDSVEVLSLVCSFFIALWGLYTFMMSLPEKIMMVLFFMPLVGIYTVYKKAISFFETKEEEQEKWALESNDNEVDFYTLGLEENQDPVFSDEEFLNTEVLEAFDLTGVEYGVLLNENDVYSTYPTCCDKLICECAWEAKQ